MKRNLDAAFFLSQDLLLSLQPCSRDLSRWINPRAENITLSTLQINPTTEISITGVGEDPDRFFLGDNKRVIGMCLRDDAGEFLLA